MFKKIIPRNLTKNLKKQSAINKKIIIEDQSQNISDIADDDDLAFTSIYMRKDHNQQKENQYHYNDDGRNDNETRHHHLRSHKKSRARNDCSDEVPIRTIYTDDDERCRTHNENDYIFDDDQSILEVGFEGINECDDNSSLVYNSFGGVDKMQMKIIDGIPMIHKAHDILIKVTASTVTIADTYIRRGVWINSITLPTSPGYDFIGDVIEVGAKVRQFQVGDKVVGLIEHGGNTSYLTISSKSNRLFLVPNGLDDAEAVSLINIYMTAYQSLYRARKIEPKKNLEGKSILVTEADTPIGQALIQILHRAGGVKTIFATAVKQENFDFLSFLGAVPLPKNPSQYLPFVENQMDIVLDLTCSDDFEPSKRALKSNGQLICLGMSSIYSNYVPETNTLCCSNFVSSAQLTKLKAKTVMPNTFYYDAVESCEENPIHFKHDLDYLFGLLKRKKIKPNVSEFISLSEVPDAHVRLESGQTTGLIICQPWRSISSLT